jgi:uncharacterized membrane protein YcaP (DUF421 family)
MLWAVVAVLGKKILSQLKVLRTVDLLLIGCHAFALMKRFSVEIFAFLKLQLAAKTEYIFMKIKKKHNSLLVRILRK